VTIIRIWRVRAIRTTDGENPHFTELTEESLEAEIPSRGFEDENLWETFRKYEDNQLTSLHEVSEEVAETETYKKQREELNMVYWEAMREIRNGFQGVRIPDGWPIGLMELHCDLCDKWHTEFRFENLHSLF
jgi:hypothetical protein